ncbi:YLP motif-containing protein 1-like isoform X3 [Bolinopsis microptera]|uniref:YLP motif-containing protein 1-like isoform X3 n=1 Tax=Bolinopsis microptera TaxID=2820187 RepID=UPI003079E016
MVGRRKNSYGDAVKERNSMVPDDQDSEGMKIDSMPEEVTSPYAERRLERRAKSKERAKSRDRIKQRQEASYKSVDTYKETTKKETFIEVKSSSYTSSEIKTSFSSSEIKSTRLDDILKSVTTSPEPPRKSITSPELPPRKSVTSPEPPRRNGKSGGEAPPPPPPARTESRDIKQILATHRSRPRRPLNDPGRNQNGAFSPPPMSPEPVKSPGPTYKLPKKKATPKKVAEAPPPPIVKPVAVATVKAEPPPPPPMSPPPEEEDDTENILDKLRKRQKDKLLNNKPGCCSHDRCKPAGDNPDQGPRLHTWPCLLSRYNGDPDAEPKTMSPPGDDLEKQTLDSLEGLTSVIVKERDTARKERDGARAQCASFLNEYDGRRQAWQNQLNVVKIRLEHYARRHDKLRNDIVKQHEKFDIERSRMKERHANQIEGLFGDLFNKIKSDDQYVGSSTGLDEVNYRLQAFMELWKGLAHDVDDLYDKEHYCLRLCETVKSLQEQINHQNKIISQLAKGVPINVPPPTDEKDLPPPNINVIIDHHKWETVNSNHTTTINHTTINKDTSLPRFDEYEKLGSLLPPEDGLSCEDILSQFAPIEDTFDNLKLSLDRPKPKKKSVATSPLPASEPDPIMIEVRDIPCQNSAPLPKPSININKSIDDYNQQPDLPIKLDPEDYRKKQEPETPVIELDTAPVVKALKPFQYEPMFDEPVKQTPLETTLDDPATSPPMETILNVTAVTVPKETTIDDPAPAPKKKRKKKKKVAPPPEPEPVVEVEPEPEPAPLIEIEVSVPVLAMRDPSPTPSFRRRRASMESVKDFSIMGDPDLEEAMSPPPLPATPKETTLDDPATSPTSSVASPKPEEKKKKWKPSMPIFNKKLPKAAPPPEPEPEPEPEVASSASSSESDSEAEEAPSVAPSNPNEEDGPPQSRNKRAKSLPRFRDPSLPRNMASVNMKRAQSSTRLKESDDDSDSDDSDIRSLIESVYMPLHMTPTSRAGSRKNVADDAKSEASSFARRNKMPGSMGWLDSNKANTSDESSSDYSDSESETSDSDVSDSDVDEQGSGPEEEDEGESSSESDGSDNSSIDEGKTS